MKHTVKLRSRFSEGQSLFEVVVALAISTLVIVAVVSLAVISIKNTNYSKNKVRASRYAQEATEWLRQERDSNTEEFITNTLNPLWCFKDLSFTYSGACGSTASIADTIFFREVSFVNGATPGGDRRIEAKVRVFWADSQGLREVVNSTEFTDWRER